MKYLDVGPWIPRVDFDFPWSKIVGEEPSTLLLGWNGMYFLIRKAVMANAIDVLAQRKTAQAKSPLPEPCFTLCDFPVVPCPAGRILADELQE